MSDTLALGLPAQDVKAAEEADLRLWSVTSIIGVLDKPALLYWAAEQTAYAAIEYRAVWEAIRKDRTTDEAVEWLRDARFRTDKGKLSATALGSVVHACCESYALTGRRPEADEIAGFVRAEAPKMAKADVAAQVEEARPYLVQFDRFLQRFAPSYQAAEVTVYSPTYGYAGQSDGFMTIDGVRLIVDYKTSRKSWDKQGKPTGPYPEAALQLAGYRYAEMAAVWRPRRFEKMRRRYYLLSSEEQALAVPVPEVDGGAVIHITPEHCEAWPVRCDEAVHTAFLYVMEAARWQFELSKSVIGMPMSRPGE